MRPLQDVTPTPEQLKIISRAKLGVEVIRGAAGSGKTTTAILKLVQLIAMFQSRKERIGESSDIDVLVLTYNRTLKGYIKELTKDKAKQENVNLRVDTFSRWARIQLGKPKILENNYSQYLILDFMRDAEITLDTEFFVEEIEYILGRFMPKNLESYIDIKRNGRGASPRVDKELRRKILDQVVYPFLKYKKEEKIYDWNDIALGILNKADNLKYDIIIVDETQDLSANQVRAINDSLKEDSVGVFILDTAQRIYARGFTWQETGITVRPENSHRLTINYRNTKEIAHFARSLIDGIDIDDDATLPNLDECKREGPRPKIIIGKFSEQVDYAIEFLNNEIDIDKESVAFLHPKGGGWFSYLRKNLYGNGYEFIEIARKATWPEGDENIALSTLHSAKGLEFDHVMILGLNEELLNYGEEDDDELLTKNRRLLAMGISRAKTNVVLGYKQTEKPKIVEYFSDATFDEIVL